ncbi:MAG: hypothetical protein JJ901_15600 [Erythrobacter sp.]|jgi:hypothetical protein|uniref:hypothetical protein n=1 Tax=Erythrobacter sp. TaxID=1042 RepID=UPI000A903D96|nr:hypothetical protein [Erythrobacter sp.]MBO6527443.1 hypothetical protein [Erythrobacter sp.]MBO6769717.1 hypothetical protein [Erythrobacter sp.]
MASLIDEPGNATPTAKDWIILGLVDLRGWLILHTTDFALPLNPAPILPVWFTAAAS